VCSLSAEKNDGNLLFGPKVMTGTPCVSRYSRVLPMSSIDFTPAHTTATGVLPRVARSALMSSARRGKEEGEGREEEVKKWVGREGGG
jgi:hypothetical protein